MSSTLIISWLALSVVIAIAAQSRGRSPVAFFLASFILSPLVAGFLVLAMPAQVPKLNGRTCPQCAEVVQFDAKVCRFCGVSLPHKINVVRLSRYAIGATVLAMFVLGYLSVVLSRH